MAEKAPKKGSVRWHPIPLAPEGYGDVKVGVRYVGAHKAREWMFRMHRISMEEKERKLSKGLKEDDNTVEYAEALGVMTADVLGECVAGVKGVEGLADEDQAGALDLLEYLGHDVEIATLNLCQEQQSLSLRQRFRPETSSD